MELTREEFRWTTRDGRTLRLSDFEDGHLLNTIRMLVRVKLQHLREAHQFLGLIRGEAAMDAAERQMESDEAELDSTLSLLRSEASSRGLTE